MPLPTFFYTNYITSNIYFTTYGGLFPTVIALITPLYKESINIKVDPIFFSKLNEIDSRRHN